MTLHFQSVSIRNAAIMPAMLIVLSGCLSEEEGTEETSDAGIRLSGSVGDGPVVGADMQVVAMDGRLLASFQSSSQASYEISVNAEANDYPLLVSAQQGTDLVTNRAPDFAMSSAVLDAQNRVANVNPFSTFVIELAKELPGGFTAENLLAAEGVVSRSMNSGLTSLVGDGPMRFLIDESNVSEIVKASETLAEIVRRTDTVLASGGNGTSTDQVISRLASDLTDNIVDGLGGSNTDRRSAAVSIIVTAQVLIESMANELHVNDSDATEAMRLAINQVSPAAPAVSIDQLEVTPQMIDRTRVGLAAAYLVDPAPDIAQLHAAISNIAAGQMAGSVRVVLPGNYRSILLNALSLIASADDSLIDRVNAVARTNGDLELGNFAPVIQGSPARSVAVGATYDFLPTASDPDGDTLIFSISNAPSWASFDTTSGRLSGVPQLSDIGSYRNIVISVSDGQEQSALAGFRINVQASNGAPVISGTPATTVVAGLDYRFVPTASDPDNDTLTFTIVNPPAWANFNSATGELSGQPAVTDVGQYTNVEISVSDGVSTADLAPFAITVSAVASNSPPQISGNPPTTISQDNPYVFVPSASDPDGDTLVFAVSGLPAWASFDSSDGRLSGTPGAADVGSHTGISISVSDGQDSAALAPFDIVVTAVASNSPPTISGNPSTTISQDNPYVFVPSASDPDGDALIFSVSGLPAWASFDSSDGRLSGTPGAADVGSYTGIAISVSDGQASAALASFDISVEAVSLGSVTLNWTAPTQNSDGSNLNDLAGYKIYWRLGSNGGYPNVATVNNAGVTTFVVENLTPGSYEFVVTSFTESGVESRYSAPSQQVLQ